MIALDIETTGLNPLTSKIICIGISDGTNKKVITEDFKDELLKYKDELIIIHNSKFDLKFIKYHLDIEFEHTYCTYLAHTVINNYSDERVEGNLVAVVKKLFNVDLSSDWKKQMQQSFIEYKGGELTAEQINYVLSDIEYLFKIREHQLALINKYGLQHEITLVNKTVYPLIEMELTGCLIDKGNWKILIRNWKRELFKIEKQLDKIIVDLSKSNAFLKGGKYTNNRVKADYEQLNMFGESTIKTNDNSYNINYSSSEQILDIFNRLGLPTPRNKYGEESTDETSLITYLNENDTVLNDFIKILFKHREYSKLISTYGEKFLDLLINGRIHTEYTQTFTKTGRLSSKGPNLQNIPKPNKDYNLRKLFIARPGHKLVTYDMSGAELRIAAYYSGEPKLIASIEQDTDLHSELASITFSIITGEKITVSKSKEPFTVKGVTLIPVELRDAHKPVIFAKLYKCGANRIYQVLSKYINLFHEDNRLEVAKQISEAIDRELPVLIKFLTKCIKDGTSLRPIGGEYRRYLRSDKLGRIQWFTEKSYGDCANYPIQGTNASALKIALINLYKWLKENNYGNLIMTVHDEITVECLDEHAEIVSNKMEEVIKQALDYFIGEGRTAVSGAISDCWEK